MFIFLIFLMIKGILLLRDGNPAGVILILFTLAGMAIVLSKVKKTNWTESVLFDIGKAEIRFSKPDSFYSALAGKKKCVRTIPFQNVQRLEIVADSNNKHILHLFSLHDAEPVPLCSLSEKKIRHPASHISGILHCPVIQPRGSAPIPPLPREAAWDPGSEMTPGGNLPVFDIGLAALFVFLSLAIFAYRVLSQRSPVWFWMGIHFQVLCTGIGLVLFFTARRYLKRAWDRLRHILFACLTLFLILSLYYPSRGLVFLLISAGMLFPPVMILLRSKMDHESKSPTRLKWIISLAIGLIIAFPFCLLGMNMAGTVNAFFSQRHEQIEKIAFFEVRDYKRLSKRPLLIVQDRDQVKRIMQMLRASSKQKDPRRVEYDYVMAFRHHSGRNYYTAIGKLNANEGSVSLSSRYGLMGWNFGGYDNPVMIKVLTRDLGLGLWPEK